MIYQQAVAYLESLRTYGWRLGNARMEAFLQRLGNPQARLRVVHVTGTNGKGSTTVLIASILQSAGYRVGAYFSPYVFDLRERIVLNGEPIPKEDFARWVALCRPHIERLCDTEYEQVTEFELKTAVAYAYFAEQKADFAVMEVGLGGRLDATNVIVPEVSVITAVGLDHTDRLGPTYADIAYEKSGIIKPGCPVLSAATHPEARALIAQIAQQRGAPLLLVEEKAECGGVEVWKCGSGGEEENKDVTTPLPHHLITPPPHLHTSIPPYPHTSIHYISYCPISSPTDSAVRVGKGDWACDLYPRLLGAYQRPNVASAVGTALVLREKGFSISDSAIEEGVRRAWLPGRLQVVRERPWLVLDGAHNPDAAAALAKTLPHLFPYRHLILVIGMLKPHAPDGVLDALLPLAHQVIFTAPKSERAYPPKELLQCARDVAQDKTCGYKIVASVPTAIRAALDTAAPEDLVLVTGSFYVVGECREWGEGC